MEKRDENYWGLKVNINKTKLMVMNKEPAVRPQGGRYSRVGFAVKECECERWCHQRC